MYHSLIGKPSLRVGLVMGLLMGLCSVLLLAACGGDNSAKGGAGQEHNKSKSGGTAPNKSTRSFAGPPSWLPGPASLAACGGGNSAKGGAGGEHNKSTRSFAGPASTDGLIVFRRDIDSEGIPNLPYTSCKSAIFTMYPNGSHIRQITHPPEGWSAAAPKGLNAWCELSGRKLSGRCPRFRVGLLPDPEGKGTGLSWSTWTPSSPHFTL